MSTSAVHRKGSKVCHAGPWQNQSYDTCCIVSSTFHLIHAVLSHNYLLLLLSEILNIVQNISFLYIYTVIHPNCVATIIRIDKSSTAIEVPNSRTRL